MSKKSIKKGGAKIDDCIKKKNYGIRKQNGVLMIQNLIEQMEQLLLVKKQKVNHRNLIQMVIIKMVLIKMVNGGMIQMDMILMDMMQMVTM